MSEYSIEVVQEGPRISFLFSSESGPVRAVSIAVVDPSNKRFLWLLHSATSTDLFRTEMDPALEDQARAKAERTAGPDLRLFAAKLFGSTANREVERLTYGEVPPGFVQGFPSATPPEALRPRVSYALCLWGAHDGVRSFEIQEPSKRRRRRTTEPQSNRPNERMRK